MNSTKKNIVPAAKTAKPAVVKGKEHKSETSFAFGKTNYILLIAGVVLLLVGYICLSGGGSDDPTKFNPALFNARRMVLAPILIEGGLIVEIFAIMIRPKDKKEIEPAEETAE